MGIEFDLGAWDWVPALLIALVIVSAASFAALMFLTSELRRLRVEMYEMRQTHLFTHRVQ